MKLMKNLKELLYWNDMLMKKLKTKSNGVLNTMVSKTEEFTISLEEMSPQKLHKWLQMLNIIFFVLNCLTVLVLFW